MVSSPVLISLHRAWAQLRSQPSQRGFSLVELLIAIGLFGVLVSVLFTAFVTTREGKPQQMQRLQATTLMQEGIEAARIVRDSGWANIATNGTYHPVKSASSWTLAANAQTIDAFTRSIVIADVFRDVAGTIVSSGGTLDPSTKRVDITVAWNQPLVTSVTSTLYLTRYLDNLTFTRTSQADFSGSGGNLATLINTVVTGDDGGEVKLTNNANADWCQPQNFIVNQIDLPKLSNAIYARQGGAYLGSGDGTPDSPAFINVAIDTPAPPASPSASIAGTFNGAYTTNSIFSDGRYMYLATNASPQVKIIDTQISPYAQVGTVTIPGGLPANSVYVSGNILFVTSGERLYTFNVATKTGGHTTVLDDVRMVAGIWSQPTARQVVVANNRAYVGTGGSLLGLQAFSYSANGTNLNFAAAALLTFSQQSQALVLDPTGRYAHIAFNNGSGSFTRGMVVIDLNRTSWFLITYYPDSWTYNTQGMDPRGIAVPTANRAVVVGVGGTQQYQVVDTGNKSSMSMCGGLTIPSGVLGVSSILDTYSNAYSYIITGETNDRFKIIRGGEGGGGYLSSGTYESSAFDASYSSSFNRITANVTQPANTTIGLQVGVAAPVAGSCTGVNYTYVGPDSSTTTYFTPSSGVITGSIPFNTVNPTYQNPNRCFKFRAVLTTSNSSFTPALNNVTVNYSP